MYIWSMIMYELLWMYVWTSVEVNDMNYDDYVEVVPTHSLNEVMNEMGDL